ncbi:hypothetical protein QAD02_019578 [Eretmocerus hayati]|uniref:Uncharacterized protein n=2 Tax=Eretmocerus hayati TaxID=131215 RepID=A0ACC2PJM3_9HYME|nr:hypothetical protein QAD02_019576 [Eretmocerus hayati]KAJ8683786.1 hypothetical protein QAD02_019578 [Eretmocerus hayati]
MGTRTLIDIHDDLKLLITAISGFGEGEEGFQICERFALSQIKHHRYLSVNSHAVKKEIEELVQKFLIQGKYHVAKEFQELVDSFLTSFDYERHPQYDIQWALLSLLLNLANETSRSESSFHGQQSRDQNVTISSEEDKSEEIDWAQYLKEGQEEFFCDYKSDSDSEFSDDENDGQLSLPLQKQQGAPCDKLNATILSSSIQVSNTSGSKSIPLNIVSRNWLSKNVQNTWWNELEWHRYKVESEFQSAHFHGNWNKHTSKNANTIGTISEYQVCREILWMFHCQSPMTLFKKVSDTRLSIQDVSIPSLTSVALKSILLSYCEYFEMMQKIEEFATNLSKLIGNSTNCHGPPLTFEAYISAVQKEVFLIKHELVHFEMKFLKQDNQQTLLSLSRDLKVYLDRIKMIFEIHSDVIEEWEASSNWDSASKLLSNLYFRMLNSHNCESVNLCASLYLSSLCVYLNIVDKWLTEGRLEDWRDEFIIFKSSETVDCTSQEDEKTIEGFRSRDIDPLCLKDPMMKVLLSKVFQMGRSVEFLVTLDRISDLWDLMNHENVIKKSLNEELRKEISREKLRYEDLDFRDSMESEPSKSIQISTFPLQESDIENNIMQQVSATHNPFLTKAFDSFISPNTDSDSVDAKVTDLNHYSNRVMKLLADTSIESFSKSNTVLPWQRIFKNSFSKALDSKFSGASKLVKDILVREYKLEEQLHLMRSVYMMENSHIMNKFCKLIFTEIESNGMWNNSYFVTCLLEEILSHEWPDWSSHWSITVTNIRTTKVLEAVKSINLHYAVGWPMNILLNKVSLAKYNKIFRFEVKLKWALWTLNTLRFSDLEGTGAKDMVQHFHIRRLESLRFWLLHAIGSIHSYLSGQILQSLGDTLTKSLADSESLEAIVRVHSEYLDNVLEHCLQTENFEDLTLTIYKLLEMCGEIRERWNSDQLVFMGKALDQLENDYVKYHTYLALGLHNAVQHKDADYLTGLSSAFNCSMPST